jgi:predicted MPP superfamily phosphohydrolase
MTSFQYFSDIHLEQFTNSNDPDQCDSLKPILNLDDFKIVPLAQYLIIAGDIGNPYDDSYVSFLGNMSTKFKKVFIIPGNHEYYVNINKDKHDWINKVDTYIKDICEDHFDNVVMLQNESYDIENTNITIFGTTLWSVIDRTKPIDKIMNDYLKIPKFDYNMSDNLHKKAVSKLNEELNNKPTRDFIVVSHHVPSYSLYHYNKTALSAYATNVTIASSPQIKAWIFGHTHIGCVYDKYYCNPIGHSDVKRNSNINKMFSI